MSKKEKMEILTELPERESGANKGKINWRQTVGMTIKVKHKDYGNVSFKVVECYNKDNKLYIVLDYNKYILDCGIRVDRFLNGELGAIMNITNSSKNTFHLDENNILHIYGENKNGKWKALYSGKHIEEVMNSTWYVGKANVRSDNYNFKETRKYLHHVDIKPKSHMVIDHIANPYGLVDKFYDNRVDNLREVSQYENNKNRKCCNELGYTGLRKHGEGWRSKFSYNGTCILTKTRHNLNECILDNLIAQKYLGYKHQEEEFWRLDGLLENRIKEVTDLLDIKIKKVNSKTHEIKEYRYHIETKDNYYILKKNGHEMLFDCDLEYIKDKLIYPNVESHGVYWNMDYIKKNIKIRSKFHRYILGLKPNEYVEYKIHVDHLNGNTSDNRYKNLAITTVYSNQCNIKGVGYGITKSGSYRVRYMGRYKFWNLIGGSRERCFSTEQEAINEVERRKIIIDNARVKLKTKQELGELIQYCLDNKYIKENNLADLDLGYLYWKGILKTTKIA